MTRIFLFLAMIALVCVGSERAFAQNSTPTKFSRQLQIKNNPMSRLSNNEDFQSVVKAKKRVQRGERNNRRDRGRDRNRNRGRDHATEDRTQSEHRLSNSNDRRSQRGRHGRRDENAGQGARVDELPAGLNQ